MRVLAATFPEDASARAAERHLMRAFGLEAGQIGVEALAQERSVPDEAVLAGRFRDDVVAAAREVVEQFGGTLVIDIDDGGRNA